MDLDIAFPESSSFSRITAEMCDYNGHMNVLFYFKLFIENLEIYYEDDLGFSKEYFKQGFSSFSLEDNIKYLKECKLGELVRTRYRLNAYNKKLIHLVAVMINEKREICSIYETIIAHVDMSVRSTSEMSEEFIKNIDSIFRLHTKKEIELPLKLSIKALK